MTEPSLVWFSLQVWGVSWLDCLVFLCFWGTLGLKQKGQVGHPRAGWPWSQAGSRLAPLRPCGYDAEGPRCC